MNLAEEKKKRNQFLLVLYKMAEGEAAREVTTKQLAERLGIGYDDEAPKLGRYWRGQGMVDWGSFDRIFLTGKGQAKAEELIEANEHQIATTVTASNALAVETMKCPRCSHAIPVTARFCESCGTGLEKFNAPTLGRTSSVPMSSDTTDSWIGQVVGTKYRIGQKLGEGNIGAVYLAQRTDINLAAAIKLLHARHLADTKAVQRFRREAEAAGRIRHPNVVSILDFGDGDANSPAFIVMELVVGDSLDKLLKEEKKLSPERTVSLMREICKAVGAGHKQNILHRDLKPANIMVIKPDEDEPERIKVLDFGLAKLVDNAMSSELTERGAVMGTPFYMSPEQCLGEPVDSRSDVYSLGVLLYEMVAGRRPFDASDFGAVTMQHINKPVPPLPADLNLPQTLIETVMRALSKDASKRQSNANALGLELKNVAAHAAVPESQRLEISRRKHSSEVSEFPNLEEPDARMFVTACQKAMQAGYLTHISVLELVKESQAHGIEKDEVVDSLEIMAINGYIQPSKTVGCGLRICDFEITTDGFEEFAIRHIPDFLEKRESVIVDIANGKNVFEKPDIITKQILDKLASDGLLQIAKFTNGKTKVMHASAQLRRKFRDRTPGDAHTVQAEGHSESLATKAATLAEGITFKQVRAAWLMSEKGREDAQEEVARLFDDLLRRAKEISEQGIEIQTAHNGEECTLRWRGLSLLASWYSGRFINTLQGTGLTFRLSETREPDYFINQHVSEQVEIRSLRYDIDMSPNRMLGWRETKGSKQVLPSTRIADIWVRHLIEEIERRAVI